MIYTINNCIRAFGYTNFDKLIADMGSVDNLKAYVIANGYADIAVAEDTELLLVDVNGKTWHTGCYGAVIEQPKPYLCFTSTGDSTVAMTQNGTPNASANKVIQYKLNDGQWQNWDLSAVTLSDGDKMYVKSDDEIPVAILDSKDAQIICCQVLQLLNAYAEVCPGFLNSQCILIHHIAPLYNTHGNSTFYACCRKK